MLSNATEKNDKEITKSPLTVQTIVGILVKVADVSQKHYHQSACDGGMYYIVSVCTKDSQIVANLNFLNTCTLSLFSHPMKLFLLHSVSFPGFP